MATRKRPSLADLVDEEPFEANDAATGVELSRLAFNPLNEPRDLGDLTSMTESLKSLGQLQAVTTVSRAAFIARVPEHAEDIGDADYVVILGNRRLASAKPAGLTRLDITVKDKLAAKRSVLRAASVSENIDRKGYGPIEEAQQVEKLIEDLKAEGSKTQQADAAKRLNRSEGWVSQRLALLELLPELQKLVAAGKMPIEVGRKIGRLPKDDQFAAWEKYQAERHFTAVKSPEDEIEAEAPVEPPPPPPRFARVVSGLYRSIKRNGDTPVDFGRSFAEELQTKLEPEYLKALGEQLRDISK